MECLERVLGIERDRRHGSPYRPGSEKAALWQRRFLLTTDGAGQACCAAHR